MLTKLVHCGCLTLLVGTGLVLLPAVLLFGASAAVAVLALITGK